MNIIENKIYETFKDYRHIDGEGLIFLEPNQKINHPVLLNILLSGME